MASLTPLELANGVAGDARLESLVLSLRERLLERVIGSALELPLLPQVAVAVLSLTARDDADPRRLSDDSALSTRQILVETVQSIA